MPVVQKRIRWEPDPTVTDAQYYRVYIAKKGVSFSYSLPYEQVQAKDAAGNAITQLVIPSTVFPVSFFDAAMDYSVWITTVDFGGNESPDPLALSGYLDFQPPKSPIRGWIENV
jgi:hypothetical protein